MVRELTHQRLTIVLVWVVLTVTVTVTHPGFADTACCGQKARLFINNKYLYNSYTSHAALFFSPESLQPNFTAGSHMCVTPSQFFSSLRSMQSVSPSQRQRNGMHRLSIRHWNSSVWQPPGGRVAVARETAHHSIMTFSSEVACVNEIRTHSIEQRSTTSNSYKSG